MSVGAAVARLAFSVLLGLSLVPAWSLALIGSLVARCIPERSQQHFEDALAGLLIYVIVLSWRLLFTLCAWIHVEVYGLEEFRKRLGSSGRPVVLLGNHLSFLDPILTVSFASLAFAGRVRVLVANYVFNIPLLGTVMRRMGLPEVPFKASAREFDDMQVDSEVMEERLSAFTAHVRRGGIGGWFPEGIRNRGNPHKLQQFRAGAFAVPARLDVEIWCAVFVGTNICWPMTTPLGGSPAHIGVRLCCVSESSRALLAGAALPEQAGERERAVFLADHCKEAMQVELDAWVKRGFMGAEAEACMSG